MEDIDNLMEQQDFIHIFGYGSLTWKPDFESDKQIVGYIKGYERRFWQASHYHRGTSQKPGRVLTLEKVDGAICWGLVFEVRGQEKMTKALDYLQLREQDVGGYEIGLVPVYPIEESDVTEPMLSIIFHALPGNDLFLGKASDETIAHDIATSCGEVGHNIEYLLRTVEFLRDNIPGVSDEHLFELDALVRSEVGLSKKETPLPWHVLMNSQTFRNLVESEPLRTDTNPCKQPLCRKITMEAFGRHRRNSKDASTRRLSRQSSVGIITVVRRRRSSFGLPKSPTMEIVNEIEILINPDLDPTKSVADRIENMTILEGQE